MLETSKEIGDFGKVTHEVQFDCPACGKLNDVLVVDFSLDGEDGRTRCEHCDATILWSTAAAIEIELV